MRWLAVALALASTNARADVEYAIDLAGRVRHEAKVEMTVRSSPSPLELFMPVWTPGAYELRTWGRNVMLDGATDGAGRPLSLKRTGPSTFRVEGHAAGSEVRVRYRVHAAELSDDASQLDAHHAYLNGTSIFLGARGAEKTLHRVHLSLPAGWRAAAALEETPAGDWEALGYEALVDAPIEAGRFTEGETHAAGRTYRVIVDGASEIPPQLLKDVAALAEAEARLVGAPPYKRYLLLIHLADGIGRIAALEHAASTSVVVPHRSLGASANGDAYEELLYVVSHELFHAWNARRLRPAELVPYDFLSPRPSRALWIAEGLTEYYAHRAMRIAGKWSRNRYFERLGEEATRAVGAARHGLTVEEEAELAWSAPDENSADPDAWYARGHLVALALDAQIRHATDGAHSLDDVLRALLAAADRGNGALPVDSALLAKEVGKLAGAAATGWVAQLVQKPNEPDRLAEPFAQLGLKLAIDEASARTIAGFSAESESGVLRVASVRPDGPAAHAGLRPGDRVVALDGQAPSKRWAAELATKPAGAIVKVEAVRAARRLAIEVELESERPLTCRISEVPAPPRVAGLREAWLSR